MTEKIVLQESLGNSTAGYRDERMVLPLAVEMESPRHELLPRAHGARDEHRATGGSHLFENRQNLFHGGAATRQGAHAVLVLDLTAQEKVFALQATALQGLGHHQLDLLHAKGFHYVIESAHLHRFDGRLHGG